MQRRYLVPVDALERVAADEAARAIYQRLLAALDAIGPYTVEPGHASFLVRNGRAFLGIHPRRAGLLVNVVTDDEIDSPRMAKVERLSRNRVHNEVRLERPGDVDAELIDWITRAYNLTR
ncbi:MAG: hypothetical protein QOE92_841 [Chloroflexota bacterium]|jgi:hypothetical protein|nr:hypothetical protein [Chloroflexota bacterium]